MARRLPVYLLLDTSGSMRGEAIEAVKVGLESLIATLRTDPAALESVHISILTFAREIALICELTPLETFILPDNISVDEDGPTHLGRALMKLKERVDSEIVKGTQEQKGDWKPLLFILTDGGASDKQDFKEIIPQIKSTGFGSIVGCAAGHRAKKDDLQQFCTDVVVLETMDASGFESFFKWVTTSVAIGNQSMGITDNLELPPPPSELQPGGLQI